MIFVIVAVLALIAFAIFSAIDVRNRSLRRRMAQYVTVPSEGFVYDALVVKIP